MLRGAYGNLSNSGKLVLLVTLVFSFLLFSSLFGIIMLVPFYGSGILEILAAPNYTDPSVIAALKAIQLLNTTGGLLLPALIYLWLTTTKQEGFPGLTAGAATIPVLLSVALIMAAQPFIGWTNELNSYLSLPEWLASVETWMKDKEEFGTELTEAFLSTTTYSGLLVNIALVAVLPALAEEILFRGVLARLFSDWTRSIHAAVILSALVFAAIHLQFYGFLPRFLLGVALGYLFFWSGSIVLPVVVHFINNFLSVLTEFLYRKGIFDTNADDFGTDSPAWLIGLSLIAVAALLYLLFRMTRNANRESLLS